MSGYDSLIMNGDLTADFSPGQVQHYEELYHNLPSNIEFYYPSLGNHDYQNNARCSNYGHDEWLQWTWGRDRCENGGCSAKHGIQYMRNGVGCGGIPKFYKRTLTSYDSGSTAYRYVHHEWDREANEEIEFVRYALVAM